MAKLLRSFRRISLLNLGAKGVRLHKNAEPLHILKFVTTCLSVINLTTDVSITITVEKVLASVLVLSIDFNIHFGKWLTSSVTNFKLTEVFKDSDFELVLVECLELLKITAIDFDDKIGIHVPEFNWQRNLLRHKRVKLRFIHYVRKHLLLNELEG